MAPKPKCKASAKKSAKTVKKTSKEIGKSTKPKKCGGNKKKCDLMGRMDDEDSESSADWGASTRNEFQCAESGAVSKKSDNYIKTLNSSGLVANGENLDSGMNEIKKHPNAKFQQKLSPGAIMALKSLLGVKGDNDTDCVITGASGPVHKESVLDAGDSGGEGDGDDSSSSESSRSSDISNGIKSKSGGDIVVKTDDGVGSGTSVSGIRDGTGPITDATISSLFGVSKKSYYSSAKNREDVTAKFLGLIGRRLETSVNTYQETVGGLKKDIMDALKEIDERWMQKFQEVETKVTKMLEFEQLIHSDPKSINSNSASDAKGVDGGSSNGDSNKTAVGADEVKDDVGGIVETIENMTVVNMKAMDLGMKGGLMASSTSLSDVDIIQKANEMIDTNGGRSVNKIMLSSVDLSYVNSLLAAYNEAELMEILPETDENVEKGGKKSKKGKKEKKEKKRKE